MNNNQTTASTAVEQSNDIMLLNPKRKNRYWMFFAGFIGSALLLFYDLGFRFYYETVLGLDAKTLAVVMMIFAVWNAINDPIASYLSDRTKSKLGRRIPYILIAAIPFGLTFFFMYNPPFDLANAEQYQIAIYAFVILFLYDFFYSVAYSNYMVLIPEMHRDQDKLRKFNFIRYAIFMFFAIVFTLLIPIIRGTETEPNMFWLGFIPAILMPLCLVVGCFGARENRMYAKTFNTPLFKSIKQTFTNKHFLAFVSYHALYNIGKFLMTSNILILMTYVITDKLNLFGMEIDLSFLMTSLVFVIMAAALPLWNIFFKRVNKEWTNVICLIMCAATSAIMQFANSILPVVFAAFLFGLAQGGYALANDLYNARVLDFHYSKTKQRAEGSYAGTGAFIDRLLSMIGPAIILIVASMGYDSTAIAEQINAGQKPVLTDEAILAIRTISGFAPMLMFIGSALIAAFGYRLRGDKWKEVETIVKGYDIELNAIGEAELRGEAVANVQAASVEQYNEQTAAEDEQKD